MPISEVAMDNIKLAKLHAEYVVKVALRLNEAQKSGLNIEIIASDAMVFCRLQDHSHD